MGTYRLRLVGATGAVFAAMMLLTTASAPVAGREPIEKETDATYLLIGMGNLQYPDSAKRAGQGGYADLSYTVNEEGSVRDIQVLSEEPPGFGFADAATSCVETWRYRPEVKDGKPVKRTGVTVRVRFSLQDPPEKTKSDSKAK